VESLRADPRRANDELGWKPRVSFTELIEEMVESDLADQDLDISGKRVWVAGHRWPGRRRARP
jgi:hypothetical protein